jgi:tetratricopeptide (TPR) repeat protein
MFDIRRLFAAPRRRRGSELDRALAALSAGRFDEALALLARVLVAEQEASVRALVLNKRGVAYIGLGERSAAEAEFRAALGEVDGYAPALVNLGNLRLEDGDLDDAIQHYEAALRSDRDHPGAHFNLGVALKRAGRTGEGVHHLRLAQRLAERRRS